MLRTQIYLPTSQIKLLKKMAWEEDISLSETIRRLVEKSLIKTKKVKAGSKNTGAWLLKLANKAKRLNIKGPKDLAGKLDFYLYGEKG